METCRLLDQLKRCDPRLLQFDAKELASALADWELRPLRRGAVLMIRGNEVHVAAPTESRGVWLSRRVIRETLGPLLEQYGCVVTTVMPDNVAGQNFVRRLGFEQQTDGTYSLERLNHA